MKTKQTYKLIAVTVTWVIAMALVTGFTNDGKSAIAPTDSNLLILHSSELHGYLEPCGCFAPMIGGFPRRAGYLSTVKTPSLRIDNGGLTEAKSRQDEIKADTVIEYLNLMKYTAINVGVTDYQLGVEKLNSMKAAFKGRMLSANVLNSEGKRLFDPYVIAEKKFGDKSIKVAVIGVVTKSGEIEISAKNPGLTVTDPDIVLGELKSAIGTKADYFVLLYHGTRASAVELVKNHPWINMVVYAMHSDSPVDPIKSGETLLVNAGQKGKYIGEVKLNINAECRITDSLSRNIQLEPAIAENDLAKQIRAGYQEKVRSEQLLLIVPKTPTMNGASYMGSETCGGCHKSAYDIWKKTKHAKAYATLQNLGYDSDPECVYCHVVGFEHDSGFSEITMTPHLKDVGCESCHGAASLHVQNGGKMPEINDASCTNTCHVVEHSPNFDFEKYWQKIAH